MKHDGINIENALKIDYLTINIKNTNPLDLINLLCANSINDNVSPEDFIYYDSGCMRSYGQSYRYLDKRFISINFNEVGSLANNGVTLNITGQGTEFFDFQCFSNFYKALIENEMIFKVTRMDLAFDDFHGVIPKHYFIEEAEKFMNGDSNISTKKT